MISYWGASKLVLRTQPRKFEKFLSLYIRVFKFYYSLILMNTGLKTLGVDDIYDILYPQYHCGHKSCTISLTHVIVILMLLINFIII